MDARVADNSFDAKQGAAGDWGGVSQSGSEVHQRQILPARENQEEAGSYWGGSISVQVNSVKFDLE